MKVLLTHPANRNPLLIADDLGLGYLASALRRKGIEVRMELRSLKEQDFVAALSAFRPDVVGIKTFCTSAKAVNDTLGLIRSRYPSIHCVIGGPQVNAAPEEVLKYIAADAAFHGDCERSFPDYVEELSRGRDVKKIPGLIRREGESITINPPDCIEGLDALGMPAWDLMPPHRGGQLQLSRYSPTASVLTSRGCSGKCTFCSEAGGSLRFRSLDLVMEELLLLKDKYRVKEIMFQDSNFAARSSRVEELCRMMIEAGFNLPWSVPYGTRWETLTPDLLKLMRRAGCYRASIGIETGSQRLQEKIRKHIPLAKLQERLRECRGSGVEIMGNFMYGFPGESREELQATLDLALELNLDYASFYVYTPYPGSELYDELIGEGVIRAEDFQLFDKFDYDNRLSEASPKELYWLIRKSLLRFYLRPRIILQLLQNLRYPNFYNVVFKLLYYEFLFPRQTQQRAF